MVKVIEVAMKLCQCMESCLLEHENSCVYTDENIVTLCFNFSFHLLLTLSLS